MSPTAPRSFSAEDVRALLDDEEREALKAALQSGGGAEVGDGVAATDGTAAPRPPPLEDAASLLQWLVEERAPFVQMAADVSAMLEWLEASLRGNIEFIVLPGQEQPLVLDFGPQMRAAVATELKRRTWRKEAEALGARIDEARASWRRLEKRFMPQPVTRRNAIGEIFRRRAEATPHPGQRLIDERRMQLPIATEIAREFHPDDVAGMQRVADAAGELAGMGRRLLSPVPGAEDSLAHLRKLAQAAATRLGESQRQRSDEKPPARRVLKDADYQSVVNALRAVQASLLAMSESRAAEREQFDFHSLALWRERWRLYELWILAHTLAALRGAGARVDDTSRIVGGRWLLKYANDQHPALGLSLGGVSFDLFYQLRVAGQMQDNMPDIALAERGGPFVIVLDPKCGTSFRPGPLAEVGLRYARAFVPAASCVMNYYPGQEVVQRVVEDPRCTVLWGLRPGSEGLQALRAELRGALQAAWRRHSARSTKLVVLMDLSPSTQALRDAMLGRARSLLGESFFRYDTAATLSYFAAGIIATLPVLDFLEAAQEAPGTADGTELGLALSFARAQLGAQEPPRETWIFTDGQSELDAMAEGAALCEAGIRLCVWCFGTGPASAGLRALAASTGGEFHATA